MITTPKTTPASILPAAPTPMYDPRNPFHNYNSFLVLFKLIFLCSPKNIIIGNSRRFQVGCHNALPQKSAMMILESDEYVRFSDLYRLGWFLREESRNMKKRKK